MTSANSRIYLIEEDALKEGMFTVAYPLGVNILIARIDGEIRAYDGKCPHMGCPLFMGSLSGIILTCPCHDWHFDLKTGSFIDAPEIKLKSHPVESEDGKLYIHIL
jgi:nitrite reductase/ring-hydroxylating ferredoxin subunit